MSHFPKQILDLAADVLERARAKKWKIATAESCTGGLVAGALTEIAGSSDVFDRGFVTYSNEAKTEMLGVDAGLIASQGAVSMGVAQAMARGASERAGADLAIAVTGIAGPGGGTAKKPVGLVCFAVAHHVPVHASASATNSGGKSAFECRFGDIGRSEVRMKSVEFALNLLLNHLRPK
jgi:nicotinamide-nucleotide amidase